MLGVGLVLCRAILVGSGGRGILFLSGLSGTVACFAGFGIVCCEKGVLCPGRLKVGDKVPKGSGLVEITNGRHGCDCRRGSVVVKVANV